jgi:hypothetical protein
MQPPHTTPRHAAAGILAVAASLILLAGPSLARTWHIAKDGSGDFTVIQPAVDAAAPGDTVLIGAGRYLEHAPFDFGALTEDTYVVVTKPNLTIRGSARDAVILGPENYSWPSPWAPNGIASTPSAPGLLLQSLSIANIPEGLDLSGSASVIDCDVRNCRIGLISWAATGPRLQSVTFSGHREDGVYIVGSTAACLVSQCLFSGANSALLFSQSTNVSVEASTHLQNARLQLQTASQATISGCTFAGGGILVLDSNATLTNNRVGLSATHCLDVANGYVEATSNVFAGGQQATIMLRSGSDALLRSNHILNGGSWSVRAYDYVFADHVLDLRENWWGSPYGSDIRRWIYDGWDDEDVLVKVLYYPYAEQPVPSATRSFGDLKSAHRNH